MGNVIGPISHEDWLTMRMLRESIQFMKKDTTRDRTSSIEKEGDLLKMFMEPYLSKPAQELKAA